MSEKVTNVFSGRGRSGILSPAISGADSGVGRTGCEEERDPRDEQRGGSVISQALRRKVYSPIIPAAPATCWLRSSGGGPAGGICSRRTAGADQRHEHDAVTVSSGQQAAVTDLDDRLRTEYPSALYVDALTIAGEMGNTRTMNMVLAGALSTLTRSAPSCGNGDA